MDKQPDQIAEQLILLYTANNTRQETRFRKKLENIDWDKEQKKHKRLQMVGTICFFTLAIMLVLLFAMVIYGFIQHKPVDKIAPLVTFGFGCMTVSIVYIKSAQQNKLFTLIRKLLD